MDKNRLFRKALTSNQKKLLLNLLFFFEGIVGIVGQKPWILLLKLDFYMTYSKQKFPHLLLHFAIHYCFPHRCSSHDLWGTLCFLSLENFPHKQTFCCDLLLLDSALRHSQYWKFHFCTVGSRFHCETILLLQVDSHLLYILSSRRIVCGSWTR